MSTPDLTAAAQRILENPGAIIPAAMADDLARAFLEQKERIDRLVAEKEASDITANAFGNSLSNIADTVRSRGFVATSPMQPLDERVIAMAQALDAALDKLAAQSEALTAAEEALGKCCSDIEFWSEKLADEWPNFDGQLYPALAQAKSALTRIRALKEGGKS